MDTYDFIKKNVKSGLETDSFGYQINKNVHLYGLIEDKDKILIRTIKENILFIFTDLLKTNNLAVSLQESWESMRKLLLKASFKQGEGFKFVLFCTGEEDNEKILYCFAIGDYKIFFSYNAPFPTDNNEQIIESLLIEQKEPHIIKFGKLFLRENITSIILTTNIIDYTDRIPLKEENILKKLVQEIKNQKPNDNICIMVIKL